MHLEKHKKKSSILFIWGRCLEICLGKIKCICEDTYSFYAAIILLFNIYPSSLIKKEVKGGAKGARGLSMIRGIGGYGGKGSDSKFEKRMNGFGQVIFTRIEPDLDRHYLVCF